MWPFNKQIKPTPTRTPPAGNVRPVTPAERAEVVGQTVDVLRGLLSAVARAGDSDVRRYNTIAAVERVGQGRACVGDRTHWVESGGVVRSYDPLARRFRPSTVRPADLLDRDTYVECGPMGGPSTQPTRLLRVPVAAGPAGPLHLNARESVAALAKGHDEPAHRSHWLLMPDGRLFNVTIEPGMFAADLPRPDLVECAADGGPLPGTSIATAAA